METTLYDDNLRSVKRMKTTMTLDLNASASSKPTKFNDVLGSPDLGLLMLASPDLERFIIQQNGLVFTTPTPTSQILYPKTVSEEQEAYARGFVDALGKLHETGGPQSAAKDPTRDDDAAVLPTLTTTTMLPGSVLALPAASGVGQLLPVSFITSMPAASVPATAAAAARTQANHGPVKWESSPQTVPSAAHPQVSPVNMDDQELVKLERKRERNRVAATRCRNKKLERIARLQERVTDLQNQNVSLARTASTLRDQVSQLKQKIIGHAQRGCQVLINHNLL